MDKDIKFENVRSGGIRVTAVVGAEHAATVAEVLERLDTENTAKFLDRLNWALGNEPIQEAAKCVVLKTRSMLFGLTNADQLLRFLVGRMKVGPGAHFVMSHGSFQIEQKPKRVAFVVISLSDLGLPSDIHTEDFMSEEFCQRWSTLNLNEGRIGLCDITDPASFRMQYVDQPTGEDLWFATKRFKDHEGIPSVFRVMHHKDQQQQWIDTHPAPDGAIWDPKMKVVFRYYDTHES